MSTLPQSALYLVNLAQASKAAGDPLRMSILKLLGRGAFGVLELCQVFDIKQSSMSHHLKVLAQAGLVRTQREGNSIFYRRPLITATDSWSQWLQATFIAIDAATNDELSNEQLDMAVECVLAERAEACAEFFARHANDFKDQQDLIASFDQYGDALATILDSLSARTRNSEQAGYALEIGPGEGAFLPLLAQHFDQVTALDVSPDMLARTQATLATNAINNVECVLGDTSQLLLDSATTKYEFAVANMVLHHVPAPKTIFNEVAELLQPEGTLLITDLCRHD